MPIPISTLHTIKAQLPKINKNSQKKWANSNNKLNINKPLVLNSPNPPPPNILLTPIKTSKSKTYPISLTNMTKEPMTIPLINYLNMLFLMNKILEIYLTRMLKFRNLRRKIRNNHLSSFLIRTRLILKNSLSKNRNNNNKN